MKKNFVVVLFSLFGVSTASAAALKGDRVISFATQACEPANKAQVAELFDRWNQSLQTGDPKQVVANYAHDAVLQPTLSNTVRYTDQERIDYFRDFLKKGPVGHIDSRNIRIGCNKAVDTGIYTFTFKDGSKVPARYTFTYAWNGAAWLITSHHSSALPETM